MKKSKELVLPKEIQDFSGVESLIETYKQLGLNPNPDVISISKEIAELAFPNYCIYWKEPNDSEDSLLHFRCWWHEIDNHFHVFPDGYNFEYFMQKYYFEKLLNNKKHLSFLGISAFFIIKTLALFQCQCGLFRTR